MGSPEHAVIVRYTLQGDGLGHGDEREAVHALSHHLTEAIEAAAVGEFDGDEFGGGEVTLYAYGPDATRLFATMEPQVRAFPARPAQATLRFGAADDPTAREQETRTFRPERADEASCFRR